MAQRRRIQQPADTTRRICTRCRVEKDIATGFYPTSPDRPDAKAYGCRMPCIDCMKLRYAGGPGRGRKIAVQQPDDPSRLICTQCGVEKGLTDFYEAVVGARNPGHYRGRAMPCKDCRKQRSLVWYHAGDGRKLWRVRASTPEFKADQAHYMRGYRQTPSARLAKKLRDATRSALTRGAPTATLTAAEWREILEYHDHRCAYCLRKDGEIGSDDKPVRLSRDHVVAVTRGGEHTAENIVPACRPCNSRKNNRPVFEMVRAA